MTICSQVSAFNTQRYYPSIDLLKFLCAMLVAAIHVPPFGENAFASAWLLNYGIQQYAARIAVPFFFTCTGFLLYQKSAADQFSFVPCIRQAFKLYRLYLIWTVIYLPLSLQNVLQHTGGVLHGFTVFVRDFLFTGSYFHLWYLNAAAFAILLLALLLSKKVDLSLVTAVAFGLYLLGLLTQSWFGLVRDFHFWPFAEKAVSFLSKTVVTARNGLCEALLFISLGMLAAAKPVRMSAIKAGVGFVCSMALLFAEVAVLTKLEWIREHDMYLFLVPAAFFLLLFVTRLPLKEHRIYRLLKSSSTLIFLIHVWLDFLVLSAYKAAGVDPSASSLRFIAVLGASIALSFGLVHLSNQPRAKWIRKLYS